MDWVSVAVLSQASSRMTTMRHREADKVKIIDC